MGERHTRIGDTEARIGVRQGQLRPGLQIGEIFKHGWKIGHNQLDGRKGQHISIRRGLRMQHAFEGMAEGIESR